jgi:DNA-binding transcriptional MerR regulator
MDTPDAFPALTAAECAARTGLTARALRLYEEHGLITPRRSAGGWRQYGPQELVLLNAITLLKTAGLTLGQIASITRSDMRDLDLHQMLSIQLENWRSRRSDAERGQRIAEAALERLSTSGSLTVDELCNLIRSLEMSQPQESTASRPEESDAVSIDEAVLDRYSGFYQIGEWNILTVRREGVKLLLEFPTRPPVELRPTSEFDFEMVDVTDLPITFDQNRDGTVPSLRIRMKGGDMTAARVDGATAEQVKARLHRPT